MKKKHAVQISRSVDDCTSTPRRSRRIAIIGEGIDPGLAVSLAQSATISLFANRDISTLVVYTVKGDPLGDAIRKTCKAIDIKTVQKICKPVDGDPVIDQQILIGRLAWRCGTFYCVRNTEHNTKERLVTYALEISSRMYNLVNCKLLEFDNNTFK